LNVADNDVVIGKLMERKLIENEINESSIQIVTNLADPRKIRLINTAENNLRKSWTRG